MANELGATEIGGGYGSTGTTLAADGDVSTDGDLVVDGATELNDAVMITDSDVSPLTVRRNASTASSDLYLLFALKNSADAYVNYAYMLTEIATNTAGSEDGKITIGLREGGAATPYIELDASTGHIKLLNLPTSNPGGSDVIWNNSGTLEIT